MNEDVQFNPVMIEQGIRETANRIASSVKVCDERYRAFLDADREYDRQYAHAYLNADGAAHSKRYQAELDTTNARQERDTADAAYRYADRLSKALQDELRALQSVGASVRMAYGVAGRGEGS